MSLIIILQCIGRDQIRYLFEQNIPVEQIFHIVQQIPVIEIHRTSGLFKGNLTRRVQREQIQTVENRPDIAALKRQIQIPAQIGRGAGRPHRLDTFYIKKLVIQRIVAVLRHGRAGNDGVIVKIPQRPGNLILLIRQNRLHTG